MFKLNVNIAYLNIDKIFYQKFDSDLNMEKYKYVLAFNLF